LGVHVVVWRVVNARKEGHKASSIIGGGKNIDDVGKPQAKWAFVASTKGLSIYGRNVAT
jgi:hypothetical protein